MPRRRDETEESEDYDDDSSQQEKIQIRKPKIQRLDKFKNLKKIVINVSMTQYPVVSEVAQQLNWKIQHSNDAGDWDVFWTDFSIDPDILIRMHLFQKINHFPGIQTLARKNMLGLNLTNMGKKFPNQYNFFPLTWMLPQQYSQFRNYFQTKQKGKTRTYIVKPEADCQGRGIFLTRKLQEMQTGKHYVVQRYMARPYLLDGLKFDFRIYILLASTNPLRIYMYNQGLTRLATQLYHEPMNANLDKLCMHLTNYAINKNNPKFIFNNNSNNMGIGHKRSLSCAFKQLEKSGLDVEIAKSKIKDMIIKTIISGLPLMSHQYRCSQPEDYSGNMCFHILGFDVMLNNKGDPFIIEVNHTPSFTTDTPLDHKIKYNLVKDTLVLMNINVKKKSQLYNRSKQYNQQRLLTGKRHIYQGQDREAKIKQTQQLRDKYQKKHLGGYEKIYPVDDQEKMKKYQQMIQASMNIYMSENSSVRNRMQEKEFKKMAKNDAKAHKKPKQNESAKPKKTQSVPNDATSILGKDDFEKNKDFEGPAMPSSEPVIDVPFSPEPRQKKSKAQNIESDLLNDLNVVRVNQIRNGLKQKVEKMSSLISQKTQNRFNGSQKPNSRDFRDSSHKRQVQACQMRKSYKNQPPAQFPNIDNSSSISQNFRSSQYSHHRSKKQRQNVGNGMLKSAPKPIKMIDTLQKDINTEKRIGLTNNGNYVMPKIFALNIDGEKKQQLNFLELNKKVQSAHYQQG